MTPGQRCFRRAAGSQRWKACSGFSLAHGSIEEPRLSQSMYADHLLRYTQLAPCVQCGPWAQCVTGAGGYTLCSCQASGRERGRGNRLQQLPDDKALVRRPSLQHLSTATGRADRRHNDSQEDNHLSSRGQVDRRKDHHNNWSLHPCQAMTMSSSSSNNGNPHIWLCIQESGQPQPAAQTSC